MESCSDFILKEGEIEKSRKKASKNLLMETPICPSVCIPYKMHIFTKTLCSTFFLVKCFFKDALGSKNLILCSAACSYKSDNEPDTFSSYIEFI